MTRLAARASAVHAGSSSVVQPTHAQACRDRFGFHEEACVPPTGFGRSARSSVTVLASAADFCPGCCRREGSGRPGLAKLRLCVPYIRTPIRIRTRGAYLPRKKPPQPLARTSRPHPPATE